ncbi:1-aminocyclopropane-1-carboxylate oxidase [Abrus precatorius]|uniref:1-aminocyclopropane-1-carboxylate oxidase n=1 Tax=Abrus precatorius TaxID=3816 RepID=A0A8B8K0K2_ABRPR|nr:1-aminocyclopropane-1-carboxylate oxidase [Abrus precatorius]
MPSAFTSQLSMPEIPVDFRAPPPSPVASGRRSSVTNDEVLTEFLEASLRVPDLVLPDKIFPKQKLLETPPKVDFVSLCFHRDDALRDIVSDSLTTLGCFQLLNHGIPLQLMASVADAAAGIFQIPPDKRSPATRSPEKPWGFEEYHAGEEEEVGSGLNEEFVWCNDNELKLKMEGIWPIGYPNFSKKMEMVMSRIEMVAMKILGGILKDDPIELEGDVADMGDHIHGHELGTLCCVSKHCRDNANDRWANSLKYDVIRMLIRGIDYSHSLCLHVCNGSSEFHVYSKKSWLSFCPEEGALIITVGDQTQILSGGHYKHVIGRPIFKGEKEESISMAFLYSTKKTKNKYQTNRGRSISLGQQAILAIILTLVYHVMIYVYKKF